MLHHPRVSGEVAVCPTRCVFPARFRSAEAQGSEYTDLIKEEASSFSASSRTALLLKERRQEKEYGVSRREFGGGQTSSRGFRQAFIVNNSRQTTHCHPGVRYGRRLPMDPLLVPPFSSFFCAFLVAFHIREPNHLLFSSTFYSKMHYSRDLKCK